MTATAMIPTVGTRMSKTTAKSMIATIEEAMTDAVAYAADNSNTERYTDIFRMTTAALFDKDPADFDAATFATLQRAFRDMTTADGAKARYLRRTPDASWSLSQFKQEIAAIKPHRGFFLSEAYIASVNYLSGRQVTKKI